MGKARAYKTEGKITNDFKRETIKLSAGTRQGIENISIANAGKPTQGLAPLKDKSKLSKIGGILNGALGFSENTVTISSGDCDISTTGGIDSPSKSFCIVAPETGSTDTIDTISGRKYAGQILIICSAIPGSTITFNHANGSNGQIRCPNNVDFDLTYPNTVILIDDNEADGTLQTWRLIGTSATSGADNLGNHTAIQNLNMAGYDITNFDDIIGNTGDKYVFDGSSTYMTGSTTTSGRVNIYNNGSNVTSFLTTGILTKDIDINGNTLYLDSDGDSSIESFTDDTINFNTSSSNRMSISNTSINMANPLNMFSNDISGIKVAEFNNTGIPSSSQTGIGSTTGDMYYNALTNDSHFFRINGTTEVEIDADGIDIRNGWLELEERTAPSGLSNHARIYAKDNGSGKTQLVVIFGSGAEQVIATEP